MVSLLLHPSEPCPVPSPLPAPVMPPKHRIPEHIPKAMMDFIGFLDLCPFGEETNAVKTKLMYCVLFLADFCKKQSGARSSAAFKKFYMGLSP